MRNPILQKRARALRNASTDAERHLWRCLRRRQISNHRFRRQVPIAGYVTDFACLEARIIVELDGGQHQRTLRYDVLRDQRLREKGFTVLRFWDHDVFKNIEALLDEIMRALEAAFTPSLSLPRKAGEGWGGGGNVRSRRRGLTER